MLIYLVFLLNKLDNMEIDNFFTLYPTEASCKQYFKDQRES